MKLITKIVFGFLLLMLIILMVDGYISYEHQIKLYRTDMKKDINTIGLVMKSVIEDLWQNQGKQQALETINDANQGAPGMSIRFVWLDLSPEDVNGPRISGEKLDPIRHHQSTSFIGPKENFLYFYFPLSVDQARSGALELSESLSFQKEHTRIAVIRLTVLTTVLLVAAFFFSTLMSVRILGRPLNLLLGKIQRIGTGDYSDPLLLPGNSELSRLSAGINTMGEQIEDTFEKLRTETDARIAALDQLRHEDRLKTVGRLASGIAHELGTPLNVISGRAVMIARANTSSADTRENANIIKQQCDRITSIFRQLLDFARQKPLRKSRLDLQQMLQQVLKLMAPLDRERKIEFSCSGDDVPTMGNVDAEQLQQVIMNLVTNAMQSMPNGGHIEVGINRLHVHPPEDYEGSDGEYICIYVQDDGQGIAPENIAHIFEPFFTTKDIGRGTGLGLSIVHGIIRENGGWIDVESEWSKGSRFSIYLPVEDP